MNLIEIFLIELKFYKVWYCNVTKAHFEGVKDLILFFGQKKKRFSKSKFCGIQNPNPT